MRARNLKRMVSTRFRLIAVPEREFPFYFAMEHTYMTKPFTLLTLFCFFSSIYSEYLTGFHKRKVARKEKAAEYAKKRAHEEHLAERKRVSLIQKRKKKNSKRSIT